MQALYKKDTNPEIAEVISGACMLIKRQVFEAVGGFSPQFFMYGEDLDICFKIRQAGHKVYCAPETSIVHHGGGSTSTYSGEFSEMTMRDSVYKFFESHRGKIAAKGYRTAMTANAFVRMMLVLPCLMIPGHGPVRHGTGSLRKWLAVLRWGLGKAAIRPKASAVAEDRPECPPTNNPLPQA
jgi:GT2 family glycosyltransferase